MQFARGANAGSGNAHANTAADDNANRDSGSGTTTAATSACASGADGACGHARADRDAGSDIHARGHLSGIDPGHAAKRYD